MDISQDKSKALTYKGKDPTRAKAVIKRKHYNRASEIFQLFRIQLFWTEKPELGVQIT